MANLREIAKKALPFQIRVEWQRLKKMPDQLVAVKRLPRKKGKPDEFPFTLCEASSPLERAPGAVLPRLQKGKEKNVEVASKYIDCIIIQPGQIFSYHSVVGRPTRLRGFKPGLELHESQKSSGIGGGCCQIGNMLYWLAINAGMLILERHRHGFDLFPDSDRKVPFGCGATVFYNYRDLRFENPLPVPVMIRLGILDRHLIGKFMASCDPGYKIIIEEKGHRIFMENGLKMRENQIFRTVLNAQGKLITSELLAHNLGQIMY